MWGSGDLLEGARSKAYLAVFGSPLALGGRLAVLGRGLRVPGSGREVASALRVELKLIGDDGHHSPSGASGAMA